VRRFRIVVGAASDDFKLQRVGTNPGHWAVGSDQTIFPTRFPMVAAPT
jgi:hypothetical protein